MRVVVQIELIAVEDFVTFLLNPHGVKAFRSFLSRSNQTMALYAVDFLVEVGHFSVFCFY